MLSVWLHNTHTFNVLHFTFYETVNIGCEVIINLNIERR
jgi:hypothetical protein